MSDFLSRLAERALGRMPIVEPWLPVLFGLQAPQSADFQLPLALDAAPPPPPDRVSSTVAAAADRPFAALPGPPGQPASEAPRVAPSRADAPSGLARASVGERVAEPPISPSIERPASAQSLPRRDQPFAHTVSPPPPNPSTERPDPALPRLTRIESRLERVVARSLPRTPLAETTVVCVTIGRIDVRATTPRPTAAPERRSAPASEDSHLSLSDYLRRDSGATR